LFDTAVSYIRIEAGGGKVSAPALLTMRGFVAAARADGTIISPESPARPGDRIRVFGTGFDPDAEVSVTVGGVAAPVKGASPLGSGLYQIEITVPPLPPGDHQVVAKSGDPATQPRVLLRVRAR
jgi:uncharacterized protein (TIGR03437 family)